MRQTPDTRNSAVFAHGSEYEQLRRLLELKSRNAVLVAASAMFMAQLDGAVLVIALPRIARDFHVPVVSLSLSITIYLTMLVAMLPISGWCADRFGAKRVFMAATLGFAFFSLCCALSTGLYSFVLARALQGAAAALFAPVGRLILLRQTPKHELVDALAITAMPMLIAPTLGPSLGGFIVQYARWEYIFLLNLPISVLLFLATRATIPRMEPEAPRKLDIVGAILVSGALTAVLTGIDRLVIGIDALLPWGLILGGLVLAGAAWRHLESHPSPILTFGAMRNPGFRTAAIGAGAVVRLPARAMLLGLPLMLQLGFGFSPLWAGVMLIALNGGDLVTKPLIKPAFDRYGYRVTTIAGSLTGLAALAFIALARPGAMLAPLLLAALTVCGMARSLTFTAMTSLSFSSLTASTMTSGNIIASISMQIFNALGVSITAVILSLLAKLGGRAEPAMIDYRHAMLVIVLIGLAATIRLRNQIPEDLAPARPRVREDPEEARERARGDLD